jgi:hypothetical protein
MDSVFLPRPDVLVRADGGVGLPALGSMELTEPNSEPVRLLLVVDVDDRHHPVLRRRSRSRREAYDRRGWFAPGVEPVQARVNEFLATRPAEVTR